MRALSYHVLRISQCVADLIKAIAVVRITSDLTGVHIEEAILCCSTFFINDTEAIGFVAMVYVS